MKKITILTLFFLLITSISIAQSKSDLFNAILALDAKIVALESKVDKLKDENMNLKLEVQLLKASLKESGYPYIPKPENNNNQSNSNNLNSQPKNNTQQTKPVSSGRCQATTKKGSQCSRNAQPGRNYCYQH